ncbi:fructose-1,6-bisphosphatase [Enhydrobacter aerosaccus]|uniref:Fructose-1,6-bisphosphatase n=1 Tax=Enhydrobacter aerosaccus TaxID=225324 RepID=A0A1T4L2C2_9HYPH|nr:inositol monophosphatase [Enhydrobacter aerosaccus]SJZ48687.1 fructose-1,6-bisphosphatase [Enhydrobacter aerosaccus]
MLSDGDFQRVAELMRETAAAELLPRFRNLAQDEIRQKRPGDFVTVADVASEQRLATGLAKILPGVPVVGEEAVEKDAGLVDLIARPHLSCWIVDPLDGTANFAAGRDRFAMIICLVHDNETIGGWILDVPNDRMAMAGKGQGVTLDRKPIRGGVPGRAPKGLIGYRIRKEFDRQLDSTQRQRLGELSTLNCAGREYIEILDGHFDFCLYRMTKPWDHAAGALMMQEAGGQALRFNGIGYRPGDKVDSGIIASPSPEVVADVRTLFEAVQLPLLVPRS